MGYFDEFSSNTLAGTGNQFFFVSDNQPHTGRLFYKLAVPGSFRYALMFSSTIDSTFNDGAVSRANLVCDAWHIAGMRIGRSARPDPATWTPDADGVMPLLTMSDENETDENALRVSEMTVLTFDGSREKDVAPGEVFFTDPVLMTFGAGDYLCLEITFSGTVIPNLEDCLIPAYIRTDSGWQFSKRMPFVACIGCDKPVREKWAFFGDSITQGIGTATDSYDQWNARLAQRLDADIACWNLGIGFGRAQDGASNGAWMAKALKNDRVFVCFGVNDLLQGRSEEDIRQDLTTIVRLLTTAGVRVLLQTVPPFDYPPELVDSWNRINAYITDVLSQTENVLVFDDRPLLRADEEHPERTRFGGHPNAEGCEKWAEGLYAFLKAQRLV